MQNPIKRSALRLFFGKVYYTFKKYFYWYFSGKKFVKQINKTNLSHKIFTHKTLLLRKLKDVDMWMQHNKIHNLKIAVKKLDGIIIKPGEIFSYWRLIGKPSFKKGYKKGMILNNGKVLSGVGGGLCQLSNLIFWSALHTPLTIVERWRHSYDVFPDSNRSQPFGSGATCAYPNIDLQIKNNTNQIFQLKIKLNGSYLFGKWLSNGPVQFKYEIKEKDHIIKNEWRGGYTRNNKIFKKIINKKTGEIINEEFITKNKAIMMYNPLIES